MRPKDMIQIHHDIEAASVTSLKTQSPFERWGGDCGFQFIPDTRFGLAFWPVTSTSYGDSRRYRGHVLSYPNLS